MATIEYSDYEIKSKRTEHEKRLNELREEWRNKYKNSQFICIGEYGSNYMSRQPDHLIYDRKNKKYYVDDGFNLKNRLREVSIQEINNNKKKSTHQHYTIYDEKNYEPMILHDNILMTSHMYNLHQRVNNDKLNPYPLI
jgi:hypothetical protein